MNKIQDSLLTKLSDFLTQTRGACSTAEQCPYCNKTISSRSNLKKHIRSIHQQLRPFQCDECKQTFAHHHHLKAHRRAAERKGRCFAARKTTEDAFKFLFLEWRLETGVLLFGNDEVYTVHNTCSICIVVFVCSDEVYAIHVVFVVIFGCQLLGNWWSESSYRFSREGSEI